MLIFVPSFPRKSTLMSKLTGTHSEASEIDFTTLTTVPGTLKVHGAPIQILDLRAFSACLSSLRIHPDSSQLESLREQTTVEVEVDKVRSPHHHNHVLSLTVTAVIAGMLPPPSTNSIHRSSFLR